MQYRFNAIKNRPVRLILEADEIYDFIPVDVQIATRDHEPLYYLRNINKNIHNRTWFVDWVIPNEMSHGLYDLIWSYDKTGYGNLYSIVSTLSVHEPPSPDEFNQIELLTIKLIPDVIIPEQHKFIDIFVECPKLSVIPELHARIIEYYGNDIAQDWSECICVHYGRFRLYLNCNLEKKLYQIDAKIKNNEFEFFAQPHLLFVSNRRLGIDYFI